MSELLVYKASAGSGKTFTLAVEYIKLLILNPRAYRQILAVTFTNKATAEMKERILSQLYGIQIGDRDSQAYLDRIKKKPEGRSRKYGSGGSLSRLYDCTITAVSGWKPSTRSSNPSCVTWRGNWNSARI